MAETPNLGLPLIDSNMTADVPRDVNALANAVDAAVGDMSSVPTDAKDAAGAISELHAGLQSIDTIPSDGSITPAKLSFDPATQTELNDVAGTVLATQSVAIATQNAVNSHTTRNDNPHGVTKSQVGLGNVQNYGMATQAQAEAGAVSTVFQHPIGVKQYVDKRLLNNLQFRINGGSVEYLDGGVWKSVAGTLLKPVTLVGNHTNGGLTPVVDISGKKGVLKKAISGYAIGNSSGTTVYLQVKVTIDGAVVYDARVVKSLSGYFYIYTGITQLYNDRGMFPRHPYLVALNQNYTFYPPSVVDYPHPNLVVYDNAVVADVGDIGIPFNNSLKVEIQTSGNWEVMYATE